MGIDASDRARRVTTCRVCNGTDWQNVVSFGPVPLANGFLEPAESYDDEPYYPLGVISCRHCRLMSVTHVVDPEVLYRSYPYVTSTSETISRHMRYVAETCRRRFALDGEALVVEFGSNTGAQLTAFQDIGLRTVGVDPASNLAEVANRRGVETVAEFFSARTAELVAERFGRARLLLGRHVFAHIDDLPGVLAGARRLLTPDGVLVIEVPYAVDLVRKVAFDTVYHEHLSYFLVSTLDTLFARHGLRLFDVERTPVHGGSILVFAGPAEGPWPTRPSVGELVRAERRGGLRHDAAYQAFAADVARVRTELPALVRRLRAGGSRIAGYGASAKGNTILNVCGIGADVLEFCSDTTTLKQDKVLPGTHVPVQSPERARLDPPDYYLLLAWNYAEEIVAKERDFLRGGGRFVLPIPEPMVVGEDLAPQPARPGLVPVPRVLDQA